jgi:hypothetical protein
LKAKIDQTIFTLERSEPMTIKQRLHRAEFLTNWFLEVFKGRKAPFPRRCFKGIAQHMEELLASGGPYKAKYKKK